MLDPWTGSERPDKRRRCLLVVAGLLCFGIATAPPVAALSQSTPIAAGQQAARPVTASTVPRSSGAPRLTLAQWKQRYERVIGALADDVLVSVDDGKKGSKHPTNKAVNTTVSDCQKWLSDAEQAPNDAPAIPATKAEKSWMGLVSSSIAASSECLDSLENGSKSAATDFQKELVLIRAYEGQLAQELGS